MFRVVFLFCVVAVLSTRAFAQGVCKPGDVLDQLTAPYLNLDDPRLGSSPVSVADRKWIVTPYIPAVGRVEVKYKSDGVECARWCTGALLDDSAILTAHHCIPGDLNDVIEARIRFGFDSENPVRIGQTYELDVNEIDKNGSDELDYSVVRIKRGGRTARAKYGALNFRTLPDPLAGEALVIVHHPNGLPTRLSMGCEVTQTDSSNFFSENCRTSEGSSGGIIFGTRSLAVVGMIVRDSTAVRIRAIAANSKYIQGLLPQKTKSKSNDTPLALLRGAYVYLGKKSGLQRANAEKHELSPFGKNVLLWISRGNPLSGEPLHVEFDVRVRTSFPTIGDKTADPIAVLHPGMIARVINYTEIKLDNDISYWGRIEDVSCGGSNAC